MAATSSLFGVARTSTSRPTGVIIAPPMPCRKRATTKAGSDPDIAQATEPSMKTPMAVRKTFLAPKRSAIQPLTGMKTASDTQIGGQRQLQRDRAGADVGGDRRQRCRDDGRVHVFHEQGDRQDERNGAVQIVGPAVSEGRGECAGPLGGHGHSRAYLARRGRDWHWASSRELSTCDRHNAVTASSRAGRTTSSPVAAYPTRMIEMFRSFNILS